MPNHRIWDARRRPGWHCYVGPHGKLQHVWRGRMKIMGGRLIAFYPVDTSEN